MSSEYDAELWNVNDSRESYGTATIEAATDDEAKAKAHEWALTVCRKEPEKKARLVLAAAAFTALTA